MIQLAPQPEEGLLHQVCGTTGIDPQAEGMTAQPPAAIEAPREVEGPRVD